MPDVLTEIPNIPMTQIAIEEPKAGRRTYHPALLSVGSAIALWFAFPPAQWSWLAWVAVAPVFSLVTAKGSIAKLYLSAWLGGLVFWHTALYWINAIDPAAWAGWLALSIGLSLGWPIWLWCARRGVACGIAPIIAAPVAWVGIEYLRAFIIGGFPWYYLAHSQYSTLPVIQMADFAGTLGVCLLMAFVNALACDLAQREEFQSKAVIIRAGSIGLAVVLCLGYGFFQLATVKFAPGPRVALLQSNLLQRMKSEHSPDTILAIFRGLIGQAVGKEQIDLIVWPETAYPYSFIDVDPRLSSEDVKRIFATSKKRDPEEWVKIREIVGDHLRSIAAAYNVPMLIGAPADRIDHRGANRANSAILVEPDPKKPILTYQKVNLVPFGEYIPLIDMLPFLTALTPYPAGGVPHMAAGEGPAWFDVGRYRYSPLVCFEDTIPSLVRRSITEAPDGRHPDVLINVTNDGWFDKTIQQKMHLATSVFRCVENRVPMARAVNTGISAVIDGNGAILENLEASKSAQLTREVPLDGRKSLYPWVGDWVGTGCLAACLAVGPLRFYQSRRPRRISNP